jgi:hypothetical protein
MPRLKLGYRELIFAIVSELPLITRLFKNNPNYSSLIRELTEYEYNDDNHLPYQKDLLEKLSLSRTKLMELMNDLYEDFSIKLSDPKAYTILDTEIYLIVKIRDDLWIVGIDGLTTIPRVGEDFLIPFIKERFGSVMATVKEVEHEIFAGKHTINIMLESKFL